MEIGDWVLAKIEEKGVTKSLIYKSLGMTEAGFRGMLKKNNLSVKNYLEIVRILSINPNEYFSIDGYEIPEIQNFQANEPSEAYRKVKNYANEVLKTENQESDMSSLIKQNLKLVEIIDRLTK